MNEIHQYLKDLFKKNKNYISEEGELLIYKIVEDARLQTKELIKFLMKDKQCKEYFFEKIDDITIFKSEEFRICVNDARFLGNSFTRYLNKIGLMNNYSERMIMDEDYIVLNYYYKDCILDGGMTKEEAKRTNKKETMINNILFKKDIHKLKSPKVLNNFRKFSLINDKVKESKIEQLTGNENLLINGNNFAALCCLKEKFSGKVKLIYIDPPYNTGNDTFSYNDNFNHSAWLVFMKDRLKIARELLKEDGVIFIQCDDNEQAYLKVLMDEIFGRDNFVCMITCKVKSAGGLTTDTEMFFDCAEYLLVYSKNIQQLTYNSIKVKTETVNRNSKTAKQYNSIINKIDYDKMKFIAKKDDITYYKITKENFNIETLPIKKMSEKDFFEKRDEIFRLTALSGGIGKKLKRHIEDFTNNEDLFVFEYIPTKGKDKNKMSRYLLYKSQTITMLNKFLEVDKENQTITKLEPISNIFQDDFWQGISTEGDIKFKNAKKPEALLKRIIEISTNEGDLILDFFAGSGTTLAVAHKMKRQYIGVEQIERHFAICIERLKKVIEGEQGGISKKIDWTGGGEFICCNIATYNANWIKKINTVKNDEDFEKLFEEMKKILL